MSAHAYLTKAKEFDEAGRRSEAIKLYCSGVTELQQTCKGMTHSLHQYCIQDAAVFCMYISLASQL